MSGSGWKRGRSISCTECKRGTGYGWHSSRQPPPLAMPLTRAPFPAGPVQVIAVICVLVWVVNLPHFKDPIHGSWFAGEGALCRSHHGVGTCWGACVASGPLTRDVAPLRLLGLNDPCPRRHEAPPRMHFSAERPRPQSSIPH